MLGSKSRTKSGENWAEEVIAAALKSAAVSNDSSPDGTESTETDDDDEGIVSDESLPSHDDCIQSNNNLRPSRETKSKMASKTSSKFNPKSKSTMYLNEDSFHTNQGNIVRFLRSLVLNKNGSHVLGKKSRVFGRDLKLHLTETKQESKDAPFFLLKILIFAQLSFS